VEATVAFDHPARSAFIPSLVAKQDVTNAISVYEVQYQFTTLVGPVLAGWLLTSSGPVGIYGIDALSTLLVLLALFLIKHSGEPSGAKTKLSLISMKDGLTFVKSNSLLWSSILLDGVATFLASATVLLPIYATEILHVGPQGLGVLYAAPALGAIFASALLAWKGRSIHQQGKMLLLTVTFYALATIVFGLSRFYPLSLIALVLVGSFDSVSKLLRGSLQLRITPDALRGRLSSITMMFWMGGPQLGEFEAGILAAAIGAPLAVAMGGLATIVFVGIIAVASPQLRKYRVEE
jgi:MFS family permease